MKPQRMGMPSPRKAILSHLDLSESPVLGEEMIEEGILELLKVSSHDIRGCLVSVAAALKLLKKGSYGNMDEGVKERMDKLFRTVTGLIGILEDSMGRAFSLSKGIVQTIEEVNLKKDVLDPVLEELSGEITTSCGPIQNGLDFVRPEGLRLMADRYWLKAVFRDLLRNAIKYGGKGVKIAIGLRDLGTHIRLNVYNSGLPIPKDKRTYLFSRFGRLSSGNDTNMDGVGLGLYLVHEVIRSCGGHIWYEAKEYGSNFVFTLPKV